MIGPDTTGSDCSNCDRNCAREAGNLCPDNECPDQEPADDRDHRDVPEYRVKDNPIDTVGQAHFRNALSGCLDRDYLCGNLIGDLVALGTHDHARWLSMHCFNLAGELASAASTRDESCSRTICTI